MTKRLFAVAALLWLLAPAQDCAAEPALVPLRGAYNVRDLGGYAAAGGAIVRHALVYRSGDLNGLTGEDMATLEALGIRTIVDFRSPEEIAKAPHKVPSTVKTMVNPAISYGNVISFERAKTRSPEAMMLDLNRSLATDAHEQYREFFRLLADPANAPLLFNCSCGKDRAGFAAALFLASLGVDREAILRDYLLSAPLVREKYAATVAARPSLAPLFTVKREYLEAAFAEIDAKYGGMDAYLRDVLGVDMALMRSLYAE